MARKGSRKVRTGCLTCKKRKVKCDETKPCCQRCVKTGRVCDGYAPPKTAELSCPRPDISQWRMRKSEARALQFFCEIAGPTLSGPIEPYFWTNTVMQLSYSVGAVKHSVIAISSLYEQVEAQVRFGRQPSYSMALKHYNAAIRELKKMDDQPLILLACFLFICIELLQSSPAVAVRHCNHGVAILKQCGSDPWVMEHLAPMFRRISAVALFFGGDFANFPDLAVLGYALPAEAGFSSFSDAANMIDDIFNCTVRLVRWGEVYRIGSLRGQEVSPHLLEEQQRIHALLDQWYAMFEDWRDKAGSPIEANTQRSFFLMRYQICRIWSSMAFSPVETDYDKHMDIFKSMIAESRRIKARPERSPTFCLETAFTPMLFSIAMKCRSLQTRLEALRLIKVHGVLRENLWECHTMHAIGRRLIEIEHGMILDHQGQPSSMPASYPGRPPEERRVQQFMAEPPSEAQANNNGPRAIRVNFFMRTPEDTVYVHSEILASEDG
ncbi:hypothetical protein QQS21_007320 [Conoideocrella luteorostrata]|uniref:Zn(2)-C6 fungal-type domain-containing protein n=1 Tax=Conoideocrella luteorostrata TaxID=1105319 RepID=A0AAJ0CLS2_9HYPO|nr:hypothetical protein QQS21_007320 [Conoideocrella luteorostrata]